MRQECSVAKASTKPCWAMNDISHSLASEISFCSGEVLKEETSREGRITELWSDRKMVSEGMR